MIRSISFLCPLTMLLLLGATDVAAFVLNPNVVSSSRHHNSARRPTTVAYSSNMADGFYHPYGGGGGGCYDDDEEWIGPFFFSGEPEINDNIIQRLETIFHNKAQAPPTTTPTTKVPSSKFLFSWPNTEKHHQDDDDDDEKPFYFSKHNDDEDPSSD